MIPHEQPPAELSEDVRAYLERMFVGARLADQNSTKMPSLSAAVPVNPQIGKLYYFKPIAGTVITIEGLYVYKSDGDWYHVPDICTNGAWEDYTGQLEEGNSVGGAITFMYPQAGNYKVPIMNGTPQRRWQVPFHIRHDPKRGSVIFPHVHWTPDGSVGAGQSVTFLLTWMAAKGHTQEAFSAPVSIVITQNMTNPLSDPIWTHAIAEGTDPATQGIPMPEVDSLVLVTVELQSKTSGVPNVGGLFVDLHYERERLSTKSRAPDFYT